MDSPALSWVRCVRGDGASAAGADPNRDGRWRSRHPSTASSSAWPAGAPPRYAEVVRAKILLLAYEHPEWSNAAIARAVGCTDWTVRKWRRRSRAGPALQDAPRPGGPRFFPLSGPGAGHRVGLHLAAGFR